MNIYRTLISGTLALMLTAGAMATPTQHDEEMNSSATETVEVQYTELNETNLPEPSGLATDPNFVEILEPFTLETNYMSKAGFYRYAVYANTDVWMTRDEAVASIDY